MDKGVRRLHDTNRLTRIRVTGAGGSFSVQNGDEAPVTVRVRGSSLLCDCSRPSCLHITSLLMCGFFEQDEEAQLAA